MSGVPSEPELVRPDVAGSIIGKQPKTLANWRWQGRELEYYDIGGRIYYDRQHLLNWLETRRRRSTSEVA